MTTPKFDAIMEQLQDEAEKWDAAGGVGVAVGLRKAFALLRKSGLREAEERAMPGEWQVGTLQHRTAPLTIGHQGDDRYMLFRHHVPRGIEDLLPKPVPLVDAIAAAEQATHTEEPADANRD